ncbi:MAG: hypothetical protein KJ950_15230 [Proteobacteria bacterium]|nr:hypothetical protein [Pseudomonadota bacterium]MBU1686877.1 hypothetical protein [Pseudomonadota bacterium]
MPPLTRLILRLLPDSFQQILNRKFPDWHPLLRKGEIAIRKWYNELINQSLRLFFLGLIVTFFYTVFLYFLQAWWQIFQNTQVGRHYILLVDANQAREITWILSRNLSILALNLTLSALATILIIGICSQLLFLRRYFYVGRSLLLKLAWLLCSCFVVSLVFDEFYALKRSVSFGLCLPPTLAVFSSCFNAAGRLIPELNFLALLGEFREKRQLKNLLDDIDLIRAEKGDDN